MMKQPTACFLENVHSTWGNPSRVADAGLNEIWNHTAELDHDDQVECAKRIGIIAGTTAEKGPEAFIEAYTAYIKEFNE